MHHTAFSEKLKNGIKMSVGQWLTGSWLIDQNVQYIVLINN